MMDYIPITLVKEYAYCPMLAYYKMFMYMEPPTPSMTHPSYSIHQLYMIVRGACPRGRIILEHPVRSRSLGIRGVADAIIDHGSRITVIEVKLYTNKQLLETKHKHWLIQATAYTIAAEETLKKPIHKTIIVSLEDKNPIQINITPWHRATLKTIIGEIREMIKEQKPPNKTREKWKCKTCHYKKHCTKT